MEGTWTRKGLIKLPNGGVYEPQSDDLSAEIDKAAESVGLRTFAVFIDGVKIARREDLYTNSIAALTAGVTLESDEPVVEVAREDKPAL